MIQVTRPFLPPLEEYIKYLKQIWDRNWLTNNGPLLLELEQAMKQHLQVQHLQMMVNGTVTMQVLLKTLPRKGKILTTPFSYIATTSVILWENFTPVFVDIDPGTLNATPENAAHLVDQDTVGVLVTHCFGVPCDVHGWDAFSKQHNIPVIYDAAHAFGVKVDGQSVLNYGYASSLSLHATKLFHTVEGGAIVTTSAELEQEILIRKNFGHNGPDRFSAVGINGKNSEIHSAMGLLNLKYIDSIFESRKSQYLYYQSRLTAEGLDLQYQVIPDDVTYNYSYFPVLLTSEEQLLHTFEVLNQMEIFPRRYFYPALNELAFTSQYPGPTPVAESVSRRVMCLPLFYGMEISQQDQVIDGMCKALRHA